MVEFVTVPLESIAQIFSGGTPSKADATYWNGNVPWLTPKDMAQWNGSTEETVSARAIGNGTRLAPEGASYIAVRGMSLHNEIRILRSDRALTFNQDIKAVVPKEGIDSKFLYYALLAKKPELLASVEPAGHGTGVLHTEKLRSLAVRDMAVGEQHAIAELLSNLDDKIDLNRRMNETLETMARAIFKDWFVDFGPTRAKAEGRQPPGLSADIAALFPDALDDDDKPVGWTWHQLGAIADLNWGDTNTTKQSYVSTGYVAYSASGPDGVLPYYDFDRTGVVLSAIGANCGITWLARGKWSCIKNTIRFWSKQEYVPTEYLFICTDHPDFWPKRGSAQPFISQGDARAVKILIPSEQILKRFAAIAIALYEAIHNNTLQNLTLSDCRDLLLPKLMSGEIRLKDAETAVEAVV